MQKLEKLPVRLAHNVEAAADRCSLSRSSLYLAIGRGELRVVKVGGRTVILESDLVAFLEAHRVDITPGSGAGG